jgi:glucose-6-phosphate 1-epimerase
VERLNNPPASPKPVRGGTPVCWPWFAAHPSDPTKPAHGFVRTKPWSIEPVAYSPDETRVRLSTRTTSADKVHWPHEAELQLMATLTDTLTLELRTLNTGAETFVLTEALHTYFSVSDISNVSVEGFDAQTYADKLDGFARKPQHGAIAFTAEVDRVYDQHTGGASIIDSGFRRRIDITKTGSGSSVVWNPWSERCARLGDMGPDGYRTMVCVETANAGTDTVTLAPGASHTLTAAYRVVHL